MSMDQEAVAIVTEALKAEGVNLVVTLPEEPTSPLIHALREDAFFTIVDAASEGSGVATAAGASLSGRTAIFVTGVAGMLVGTWALSQVGTILGAPMVVMASYRGDFGDSTGIPGSQSLMFKQVAEPLLQALQLPYLIVDKKDSLKRKIRDAIYACRDFEKPVVMLLAGEVVYP